MKYAYAALGDVTKIGRKVATPHECETLPYVGLEHIESKTGHLTRDFRMQSEKLSGTKFSFNHNHVLYGKLRPYLDKRLLPDFAGVCSTELMPISPKPVLDRSFLFFALSTHSFVSWASNNVSGANLPRLLPSILEEYRLPLPSLEEQRRIAGILERADRLRRLRLHALEISDTYLQSVFLEMFGDPSSNFKLATLEELDTNFRYGTSEKCHERPLGYPVLRIPNVMNRDLDLTELKYAEIKEAEYKRIKLEQGDLIFVRTNGNPDYVGRCSVFNLRGEFTFASYLIRARIDQNALNPIYLKTFLQNSNGRDAMNPYIRTTAGQSNISVEGLGQIPVPLPPLELQRRFARVVQRHERLRAQQLEGVRLAQALYDALLHQAFAG